MTKKQKKRGPAYNAASLRNQTQIVVPCTTADKHRYKQLAAARGAALSALIRDWLDREWKREARRTERRQPPGPKRDASRATT